MAHANETLVRLRAGVSVSAGDHDAAARERQRSLDSSDEVVLDELTGLGSQADEIQRDDCCPVLGTVCVEFVEGQYSTEQCIVDSRGADERIATPIASEWGAVWGRNVGGANATQQHFSLVITDNEERWGA